MLEALAPIVITACFQENKVLIDFTTDITREVESLFNSLEKTYLGLRVVRLTKESGNLSDWVIYHSLAYTSADIAREIRSLLAEKGFDEIYAQTREDRNSYTPLAWNY